MGFALLAFSSFSQPLNALARWLRAPACRPLSPGQQQRAASSRPSRVVEVKAAVAAASTVAIGPDSSGTLQPPSALRNGSDTLPCAASEGWADHMPGATALAQAPRRLAVVRHRKERLERRDLPSQAPIREWSSTSANDGAAFAGLSRPRPDGRPLRVLDRRGPGAAARVMISGRMADVCAELDRLVRAEAAMQTPH
ncbi:hypothetical protein [Acidovorax sp. NCPPB 3576]|uniref:hypothetical protein n=1 Tax=Acidovorax sp. NCPPB 3576 TaxID=2940488 RepID=UPI00300E5FD9